MKILRSLCLAGVLAVFFALTAPKLPWDQSPATPSTAVEVGVFSGWGSPNIEPPSLEYLSRYDVYRATRSTENGYLIQWGIVFPDSTISIPVTRTSAILIQRGLSAEEAWEAVSTDQQRTHATCWEETGNLTTAIGAENLFTAPGPKMMSSVLALKGGTSPKCQEMLLAP